MRVFCRYIRQYGADSLLRCLARNEAAGVVYHRTGVCGDYDDFADEEALPAVYPEREMNDLWMNFKILQCVLIFL